MSLIQLSRLLAYSNALSMGRPILDSLLAILAIILAVLLGE